MTDTRRPFAAAELTRREQEAFVAQLVLLLGTVPDLAVAVVRLARRDRGVQLGPALATAALAAVTPRLLLLPGPGRRVVALRVALLAAQPLLPLAAGAAPWTVVGSRNPLWQLALSAGLRAAGAGRLVRIALQVSRRRRDTAVTPA